MIYFITSQTSVLNESKDIIIEQTIEHLIQWSSFQEVIQVDSETEGFFDFNNRMLCLQFGNNEDQFVLDVQHLSNQDKDIINKKILLNSNIIKVLHNAKFDIKFLWFEGFDIKNVYDTMIAEMVLNAGKDTFTGFYSLYGVCRRYLNIELDKEVRGKILSEGLSTKVIKYAANDVKYLTDIMKYQQANIDKLHLNTIIDIEMEFVVALAHMEYSGVKVDHNVWSEVQAKVHQDVLTIEKELLTLVKEEKRTEKFLFVYQDLFTTPTEKLSINLASPVQKLQLLKALFPEINSTDQRILSRYEKKHPIVKKLIDYNKANKLKTAFADKLLEHINPKTGRIHPEYRQILSTGRISCSKPNLQQIPARSETGGLMRKAFVPEKGNVFIGGDYAQMELRIIAELSNDPVWVDAFNEGQDLHSVLCAKTFNIPIEDVRKVSPYGGIKYRDIQKMINFGLAYGMSKFKLADTMRISIDESDKIIKGFFNIVKRVKAFLVDMGERGKKYGFIKTPLGRIRWFDGYENKDDFKTQGSIERKSKNHPIQGTNADITKMAINNMYTFIRLNNLWNPVTRINKCAIVLQVHDEIICETKLPELTDSLQRMMIEAGEVVIKRLPVIVDVEASDYWSK